MAESYSTFSTSSTAPSAAPSGNTPQRTSGSIADKVRERATAQLSTQKDRATDGLGSVASAVRQSTQQLRDQQHDTIARYVEQAADQIEKFSQQLKNKDISDLFRDAQSLARRNPALFIGSAFAIGMLGARFLKSSNPDRDNDRFEGEEYRRGLYRSGGYGGAYDSGGYRGSSNSGSSAYGTSSYGAGSSAGASSSYAGASGRVSGIGASNANDDDTIRTEGESLGTTPAATGGGSTRTRRGKSETERS